MRCHFHQQICKFSSLVRCILNFLPSLDIGVYWSSTRRLGFTKVYMKPTTSKIVMPYQDFGPDNWKIGTLIWFIRRAYTHSSDYGFMHEELTALTKRFKNVGYPD